jgi:hypothetical protein
MRLHTPKPVSHPEQLTSEHIHWLYLTLVRLPTPIKVVDLTRAVGHVLKKDARNEALARLERDDKVRSYQTATRGSRRMDYTTWYEVVTMQPEPVQEPEKTFEEWLS